MIKIYDDPENRLFRKIIVEYDFNSDSTKISAELYSLILFMKNSKDYSLEDINALGNLTKLDHLIICDNKISDISVVKYFPLLKYLEIQGNPIDNYEPLSYLPENCKVTK